VAGKYFDELEIGQTFRHQPGRTVTEADNVWFSCLTMNPQSLHVDFHAAAKAEFGKPLVNSLFTLGVAVGLSVGETTLGTTVGNLGFEKVEFPKPVFHGDTIYSETEVVEKRESRSRPAVGHRDVRAPRAQPARRGRHGGAAQRDDAQEGCLRWRAGAERSTSCRAATIACSPRP
jgi:acyl dehydratase